MSVAATAFGAEPDYTPEAAWIVAESAFDALAAEWDALVDEAEVPHPFAVHGWFSAWWRAFGAGAAMRVLTIRCGGKLVGAAALMRVEERLYGVPVRVLQAMAGDHTPRFDFVVHPDFATAVYDAIWAAIHARSSEWDLLNLRQLPEDSPTLAEIRRRAEVEQRETGVWEGDRSPFLRFKGAWNRYYDSLSYNHRRNVGKGRRRLEREAPLSLEIVTTAHDIEARIRTGMRIEARAWKARAGTAMASHASVRHFYLDLGRRLAARGLLRLHFLKFGDEHIAFSFGILYRGTIFVLKGGYEPEYAKFTPYNVMCSMIMEQGFSLGLAGYDFLGDDDPWKRQWARGTRDHQWLYVCSDGVRARCVHFLKFTIAPNMRSARRYVQQSR